MLLKFKDIRKYTPDQLYDEYNVIIHPNYIKSHFDVSRLPYIILYIHTTPQSNKWALDIDETIEYTHDLYALNENNIFSNTTNLLSCDLKEFNNYQNALDFLSSQSLHVRKYISRTTTEEINL